MIRTNHGGLCCGINHVSQFDYADREQVHIQLRDIYRQVNDGMAVEVVLTDTQLRRKPWLGPLLAKLGFRHFSEARFRNPNSGNICNVFYYSPNFTQTPPRWSFDPANCHVELPEQEIPVGTRIRNRRTHREYIVEGESGFLSPRIRVRSVDTNRRTRLSPRTIEVIDAPAPIPAPA